MIVRSINPLEADLDAILCQTERLWADMKGQSLFLSGGTGFFGSWLLESFLWINDRLNLDATAHVLTRDATAFRVKVPHLANHPALQFHEGDIASFSFPAGEFPYVIHAATPASALLNLEAPLEMLDTIVAGTRHMAEFARHRGTRRFLLTSSGAVYGRQPADLARLPESHLGCPDPTDPKSAYAEGKRFAELISVLYGREFGFETTIARCFAFLGPYLPLDSHFAAGNFVRDGLRGGPIVVKGDGRSIRSYLYAADLVIWLWTLLFRGDHGRAYNVGSAQAISVAELAHAVGQACGPGVEVQILGGSSIGTASDRYVPDTSRAQSELNLQPTFFLQEAIERMISWHRYMNSERPNTLGVMTEFEV